MIHASVELVEAMRGECPVFPFESPNISGPHARAACTGAIANERIVWGYARGNSEDTWRSVTCPACLALMAEARGPERTAALAIRADELEERAARIDYLLLNAGPPGSPTGIAILAQAELERRRDYCRRSIAAIRSAVPVVPGVAEETAA